MPDTNNDKERSSGLNRWTVSIAAIIALVLAVNGYMAYLAVSSGPGLVSDDYYERGLSFTSRTALEHLSPRHEVAEGVISVSSKEPGSFLKIITLAPRYDKALPSGDAVIYLYRSSDATKDFSVPMSKSVEGEYSASVQFPLKGIWDIIVEINNDANKERGVTYAQRVEVTR
ncbi:hypothetical protein MNBD_NITROSPINAE04-2669 [hydrothermal vent metagenome]|uniref:Type cbb3 cytochrome oxidase biogenesis protein CcoH n=1 Tax=hydrothermal vent metagenome TaxID=652676 RepID=A0A3B1CP80_9ZZZZ